MRALLGSYQISRPLFFFFFKKLPKFGSSTEEVFRKLMQIRTIVKHLYWGSYTQKLMGLEINSYLAIFKGHRE
jgi:hypothetical protein